MEGNRAYVDETAAMFTHLGLERADVRCDAFGNKRMVRAFRPKYLLLGIILPAALMWAVARVEYRTFVWPKEMARHEMRMKKSEEAKQLIYKQYRDTAQVKDSAQVEAAVKAIIQKNLERTPKKMPKAKSNRMMPSTM